MGLTELKLLEAGKLQGQASAKELEKLKYKTSVLSYGEKGPQARNITETPFVAFPAFDGILLGGNRGEWGGELVFRSADGSTSRVIDDNIVDVHKMPFGIVVVTGIAHLSINEGHIYILAVDDAGKVSARKLHGLPGWPMRTTLLESGELLIETFEDYGAPDSNGLMKPILRSQILGASGELRPVTCSS
jgi:hypothetical protein